MFRKKGELNYFFNSTKMFYILKSRLSPVLCEGAAINRDGVYIYIRKVVGFARGALLRCNRYRRFM